MRDDLRDSMCKITEEVDPLGTRHFIARSMGANGWVGYGSTAEEAKAMLQDVVRDAVGQERRRRSPWL